MRCYQPSQDYTDSVFDHWPQIGGTTVSYHCPHSKWISMYIGRCTLQFEISNIRGRQTSKQQVDLQEKQTSLLRHIHWWREVQLVYTPCVAPLLVPSLSVSDLDSHTVEHAETTPLHLPSSLSQNLRQSISNVCEREQQLCEAQADDALLEIHWQCCIIKGLWQFKKMNVAGTGNKPNTHMQTLYKCFNNKTLVMRSVIMQLGGC